ncbi:MAG TPA: malate--CoA ligase subunit beta [Actinomycetota bacterium]|nr:malate--CoA ligase subunit beta [Actinomycetota bacterium]
MDIHEHQAKELLAGFGVPVPTGIVAFTADQAVQVAEEIGGGRWAVKAQIHSGARGKAGGIKLCSSLDEVQAAAHELLGNVLVTNQTGPAGKVCHRVLIEKAVPIKREVYLALVLDRALERVTIIGSAQGGMEIEQIASTSPEAIVKEVVEPAVGLQAFQAREMAFGLGMRGKEVKGTVAAISGAYRAFRDLDASMVEINPLIVTEAGDVLALDAKMSFDDNALFRRPQINELRDYTQEDPREVEAAQHGLSYIGLDGEIGCIVNGAGLAMATMDLIKHAGGEPANFLDIGGGASPERVANAFRLVMSDPQVKVILVNIFAGINHCDWIAEGIIQAVGEVNLEVPLVVRLAGTNVEKGRQILADSGLKITSAEELVDAAEAAVKALKTSREEAAV